MKSIEKNSYILYNNKIKDSSSKTAISNLPLKQYKNDYKFQSLFYRVIKLERIPYMKSKRILALTGAVILIALYVSSIISALMDSPLAENLLLASLFCTIVIPAVLYGYAVALRYFKKKK